MARTWLRIKVELLGKLGATLAPGDGFSFVFDMGDDWRHRCRVLADTLDARETFGEVPREPVVLCGWGWLPDQYGREAEDDAGAY